MHARYKQRTEQLLYIQSLKFASLIWKVYCTVFQRAYLKLKCFPYTQMVLSQDGIYTLSIEIPAPIEFVLLQSDIAIELLDVDKNSAVVSQSKSDALVS